VTWSSEVKRPNYRDGMYLGAQDFVAEQDYELELRRRLSLGQHAWGIFEGLDLREQPDPGSGRTNVFILPGVAIDGFGRPVLVFFPQPLDVALFQGPSFQTDEWVNVWLLYATAQTDPARLGYEQCADPSLTTRTLETFRIEVGDQPGPHDLVRVAGQPVPDSSLPPDTSVACAGLPDDSELARWPVCLGQVHWNGVDGFVSSTEDERRRNRALGGVIAAHAYAPEGAWDLSSRRRDTGDPTMAAPVSATIRGTLTVQGLVTAKAGVELDGGQLTFDDAAGSDEGRPMLVRRVDTAGSSDLQVEIGKAGTGHDRLVVMSQGLPRLVVQDTGDTTVSGQLSVDGLLDLSNPPGMAGQDRVFFGGTLNGQSAIAIGLESSGRTLFERSVDGFNWYLNQTPGNPASMAYGSTGLQLQGGLLVGWRGNGRIRTRHVDGKDWQGDGLDNLYLNWETAKDVVVGNPGGTPSSLYVSGNIFVGSPAKQAKVDIQAGTRAVALISTSSTPALGTLHLALTADLLSVTQAELMVCVSDCHGSQYHLYWNGVRNISGRVVTFDIPWRVVNSQIHRYSYVAVFRP
jgi:hypothetical protein